MRGHVCEDAEEELSLYARLKGCGYDDVATLRQVDPLEHGPGVDVDAPADLLLGDVHAVDPVQLHLNTALFHDNVHLTTQPQTPSDLTVITPHSTCAYDYNAAAETVINVAKTLVKIIISEDYFLTKRENPY